jgi:Tripartite tricarboxylate transporter TctB family
MEDLRRAGVPLVLLLVMIGVLVASYGYDPQARALPVLVAWTTIALLVLEILVQAGTRVGGHIEKLLQSKDFLPSPERAPLAKALPLAIVWPALLVALTVLVGMLPAVLIYVLLSLKAVGRKSWAQAATIAVAVTALSWLLFEWSMSYELYRGVLIGYLE